MRILNKALIFIFLSSNLSSIDINLNSELLCERIYLLDSESIYLITQTEKKICFIEPQKNHYTNIQSQYSINFNKHTKILPQGTHSLKTLFHNISVGTYYLSTNDNFTISNEPLYLQKNTIQIIIRSENSIFGYLDELKNTPFIYTPIINSNNLNQSDNNIGSDCTSFLIYGLRRIGKDIPYVSPVLFLKYLKKVGSKKYYPIQYLDDVTVYIDKNGDSFHFSENEIRNGLIISFREQNSILYKDNGILGVIDSSDLLYQSWENGPYITSIRENGFFGFPIEIYTF